MAVESKQAAGGLPGLGSQFCHLTFDLGQAKISSFCDPIFFNLLNSHNNRVYLKGWLRSQEVSASEVLRVVHGMPQYYVRLALQILLPPLVLQMRFRVQMKYTKVA